MKYLGMWMHGVISLLSQDTDLIPEAREGGKVVWGAFTRCNIPMCLMKTGRSRWVFPKIGIPPNHPF